MKDANQTYDVKVDWQTVVPLGDTLAVGTSSGFDGRWAKAFEVVVDEYQGRVTDRPWRIDFEYAADRPSFVVYVRNIQPSTQSLELRRILDDVVKASNSVAKVGTHVYELARELREPAAPATPKQTGPRDSTPPPPAERSGEELRADAA